MSRKQRSLARKMHNKLYLNEALLSGNLFLKYLEYIIEQVKLKLMI